MGSIPVKAKTGTLAFPLHGNSCKSVILCRSANYSWKPYREQTFQAQSRSRRAHDDLHQHCASNRSLWKLCKTGSRDYSRTETSIDTPPPFMPFSSEVLTAPGIVDILPHLSFYVPVSNFSCMSQHLPKLMKAPHTKPLPSINYYQQSTSSSPVAIGTLKKLKSSL